MTWLPSSPLVLVRPRPSRRAARARISAPRHRGGDAVEALERLARRAVARLARSTDDVEVVALLTAMATSLRGGASPSGAIEEAARSVEGPVSLELAEVARQHRGGRPLDGAVRSWAVRRPTAAVRLGAAVLSLGLTTGGDLSRALDAAAATLRQRASLRREVAALASQAQASATVVAAAPLAFTLLASITDPRVLAFLVGSPAGWACIVGGALLDAVGALWMRAIIARVGRC